MNRIRQLREQKRMTQVRLSIELEVSQENISAYEKGKYYPSLQTLTKMREIFGVSIDYIMGLDRPNDRENAEQQQLLSLFDKMPTQKRQRLIAYAEGLSEQ